MSDQIFYAAIREEIPIVLLTKDEALTLEAFGFDLIKHKKVDSQEFYQCSTDCLVFNPQVDCAKCSGEGCTECNGSGYFELTEDDLYRTLREIVKKGGAELPYISMEFAYGQEYPVGLTDIGGSAIFITPDHICRTDTAQWLEEMRGLYLSGQFPTHDFTLAA
ncbi:MAG: hypothetical protein WCJ37_20590 [Syntrophus sp. (in: bacteria)]